MVRHGDERQGGGRDGVGKRKGQAGRKKLHTHCLHFLLGRVRGRGRHSLSRRAGPSSQGPGQWAGSGLGLGLGALPLFLTLERKELSISHAFSSPSSSLLDAAVGLSPLPLCLHALLP